MKIEAEAAKDEVRIELIPLLDVIFSILTFFLLAALQLTRQQAINVDIPSAKSGTPQMQEMFLVSVDEIGQTYIDQEPVSRQKLQRELLLYRQNNPNGLIVLNASKMARYEQVVEVLDLLRQVGGKRVALATNPNNNNNDGQQSPGNFNQSSPDINSEDLLTLPSPQQTN